MLICAFHTDDELYTKCADNLRGSLIKHDQQFYIEKLKKNDWHSNTCFKPQFILNCLNTFDQDIMYTDADSYLVRKFDVYAELWQSRWDIGYPVAPWKEILSGTIAFRNNTTTKTFVRLWIDELVKHGPHPKTGDQKQFQILVKKNPDICKPLPINYCKIFDLMRSVKDPVFVHYQASRAGRSTRDRPADVYSRLGVI